MAEINTPNVFQKMLFKQMKILFATIFTNKNLPVLLPDSMFGTKFIASKPRD